MSMDFRVGGTEQAVSGPDGGPVVVYEGTPFRALSGSARS
jgi:hypothetical protein